MYVTLFLRNQVANKSDLKTANIKAPLKTIS